MKKKKCTRCQIERPLNQFYNKKEAPDGKNWTCRECCEVKPLYHGKSVVRPCLGINCRGKRFKSYNGARVCPSCRSMIKNIGELYITGNLSYKRTGAVG